MEKILVTGASGFIGTQIVKHLDKSQLITDSDSKVDLRNSEQVSKLEPSDVVIHLGGKTPQKELSWYEYFSNNVTGTLNILEYCVQNKVKKLIYISSYVYGNPKYCPIDEDHPVNPHNAYTESKYLGERLCEFYSNRTDLNLIILRPFNIFGRSMRDGFLIANLANSAKTGQKATITNKDSRRDFLHVDDFVDIILKIKDYQFKCETFNVGSGVSHSFEEIVGKIERLSSKKIGVDYNENKETFISEITADISRLKSKTGWQPKISFDEGLRKTLEV
ncbi:MAG TPA: NAD(P)-dependent oxidoreductase [Candidatus Nitrosotenuis sp.]|nr:NAD(P)-dependent oxidoreductase [Candidatus Nitrosotenuis sp.]